MEQLLNMFSTERQIDRGTDARTAYAEVSLYIGCRGS